MAARSRRQVGLLVVVLAGCGGKSTELEISPPQVNWGELDFAEEPPDEGFEPVQLVIKNVGDNDVEVELTGFDFERLCAPGYSAVPASLGNVTAGGSVAVSVGVCGYSAEAGDRDSLVSGTIDVGVVDGEGSASARWSFTPVLDLGGDDTGR